MLRFSQVLSVGGKFLSALALLFALSFPFLASTAFAQAQLPIAFTLLGPNGIVARVITQAASCPQITIDGNASAMQLRAAPDQNFPVTVCEAAIPWGTKSAAVNGKELKLPKAQVQRVVVIGDTGCRLKGDKVQSCNDPQQWPFAPIAASAAAFQPDLVIHVGDYHYRESPCLVDAANCAGSPFGDNWAAWHADLYAPAAPLLDAAPWVIVRGNHEDCVRADNGYFRLLDPRPLPASCPTYTDPYAIDYLDPQLIVMDDSAVDDFEVKPDQVATYKAQFDQIHQMTRSTTWLLLHDPLYAFGHAGEKDGKEQLFIDQLTLQQASNNALPTSVQVILSGHIHLFEALSFGAGRPPQIVVGNSGTLLDPPVMTPLKGLEIGGMPVAYGSMIDKFGYVTLERNGSEWAIAVRNVNGGEMDRCRLGVGTLICGQAAIPKVGGDPTPQEKAWLALALVGGAILCIGLAIGMRSSLTGRTSST